MPRYKEAEAALKWHHKREPHLGPQELADRVSLMGYEVITDEIWPAVRAFRKFRQVERLRITTKFLKEGL